MTIFAITTQFVRISYVRLQLLKVSKGYTAPAPGAIIRDQGLRKPIYRKTAAYGHFGRDDIEFPWERTDKADTLKQATGL